MAVSNSGNGARIAFVGVHVRSTIASFVIRAFNQTSVGIKVTIVFVGVPVTIIRIRGKSAKRTLAARILTMELRLIKVNSDIADSKAVKFGFVISEISDSSASG